MSRALLVALVLALIGPASALADPCEDNPVIGSTDGDSIADVAAAVPAAGAVVVRQSDPPGTLALAGNPSFGTGMALANVHGDGCADLLAGTPDGARVDVYDGAPDAAGLATVPSSMLFTPGAASAEFGWSIAVSDRGSFDASRDLWIGAPLETVGSEPAAGVVYHYALQTGQPPQLVGSVSVDDPTLPGDSRSGMRFGRVLSPTTNGVLVGVPNAGPHKRGAVYAVRIAADGSLVKGARRVGRPGDRFGAAVAVDPRSHATIVGAPGAAQNAGAVVLYPDDKLTLHSGRRHVQATPHAGDRFGASVVIGAALAGCQEATQWAAGAPGDDVGGLRNAGSLTIATLGSLAAQTCPALLLRAGRGLPGPAITNARLGAGVALVRYRDDFDEDTYDAYAVAVPGRHEVVRHRQRFQLGAPGKITLAIPESGDSF